MNNEYLEHHGILGQKWGVRRYQNFDGSYTKAGLKRYEKSNSDYEAAKSAYKTFKSGLKAGHKTVVVNGEKWDLDKDLVKVTKNVAREYKQTRNKDYRHLRQDMLADKGKERYANGERITGNANTRRTVLALATTSAVGSQYLAKNGFLDKKAADIISLSAATVAGATYAKQYLVDERHDRQLRAYYSHTSKY